MRAEHLRICKTLTSTAWIVVALLSLSAAACKDDQPPVKPPIKPPPPPADVQVTVTKTPVLTAHARIPQNDPNFDRAEATASGVVFFFKAKPAVDLQVDNIVAGGDGKGNTYLRKITKVVSRSDTRIEVKTTSAYITDLIGEGDFAIKMTPEASKWTLHTAPEIGGRTYALDTKINVFELFKSPAGFTCKGQVSSLSLQVTPILRPDVAFEISSKITPIYDSWFGVVPISGKLEKARFVVNGSVEVGLKMTIPKKMSLTCEQDMIKFIRDLTNRPNLLKLQRHAFVQIGPVPVEATIVLEPVFKAEVALESEMFGPTASTFAVKLSMTAGVEYDGAKPKGQRESTIFKHGTSYTKTNLFEHGVDKLTLTRKGSAGFKIGMLLYDTVGPEVGLTAYAQHKLEARPPECSLYSETSLGAELSIGIKLQVPIIAHELATVSDKLPLAEKIIGHSTSALPECYLDAGPEAGPDAGFDAGPDMTTDLTTDLPLTDVGLDAALDVGVDASSDLLVCAADGGTGDQDNDKIPDACDCSNDNVEADVPNPDMADNPRTGNTNYCGAKAKLISVVLEHNVFIAGHHPSGYIDSIKVKCQDHCTSKFFYETGETGTYTERSFTCPAGHVIVGVAYKDEQGSVAPDDFMADLTLVCEPVAGGARIVLPNTLLAANTNPWRKLECPAGSVASGVARKDAKSNLSDLLDGVTVRCRAGKW